MRTIRWGLIGCGDISRKRVAAALRDADGSELTAVCRARADLAEGFAREFGARRWYADWRALLADPEIDAVYIATPVALHAEQAVAAAEAGKHVLCEKPMAMDVAECDRMLAACRAAGVALSVAYYRHFYPAIRRAREILAAGEIGRPVLAQINAFERFNPQPGQDRHWLVTRAQAGGGPMMDFGCHRIEVLMHLLGPVAGTTADLDAILFDDREVEDTAIAVLRFPERARAVLTVTHAARESRDTLDLYGSEGSIHIPVLNQGEMIILTPAGERRESHTPHPNLHQPLVEDFLDALRTHRDPAVSGEIGREVARVETAIYVGRG